MTLLAIFGIIGLFFFLSANRGKKLPSGSRRYQVNNASITKALRGPRKILTLSAGSDMKNRGLMVRVEDSQVPDFQSFPSEKLADYSDTLYLRRKSISSSQFLQ